MHESHDRASGSLAPPSGVDVLSDVLRSVRLTGSMLFLVNARPPWMSWAPKTEAFRRVVLPAAQHLISYHIVPHGDAYSLADSPASPAAYGPEEAVAFFRSMAAGELPSVVNEGADVGQPPMHYLAQWRMQRAIGLLAEPGANKVAAVAEAVGYGSEAAFSRAFKKSVGVAPAGWRARSGG